MTGTKTTKGTAMSFSSPRPKRFGKNPADYFEFIGLQGVREAFDVERSIAEHTPWYGTTEEARDDEMLFRIDGERWVLAYVPLTDVETEATPDYENRELTPADAARWLRINWKDLPDGLTPALPYVAGERLTRLDRNWSPAEHVSQGTPVSLEAELLAPKGQPHHESPLNVPNTRVPPPEQDITAGRQPNVILREPHEGPIVCGRTKERLSRARYQVVKALLEARRPVSKDELDVLSGRTDARKHLTALARLDADWESVIVFPEKAGRGYSIRI